MVGGGKVAERSLQDVALGDLLGGAAAAAAGSAAGPGNGSVDGLGLGRGSTGNLRADNGGESRDGSRGLVVAAATSGGLGGSGSSGGGSRGRGSSARARARARAAAGPDSRSGDVVGRVATVDVEVDALVGVLVTSVEVKVAIGDGAARAGNLDLDARGVELSTASRVLVVGGIGLVVGDDLLADQVLASLESGGKVKVDLALVGNELVNSPLGAVEAVLLDLGPDGAGAVGLGVGGNVGDDGALVGLVDDVVAAGVVVPLEGEGVTGGGRDELGGGLAAVDVAGDGRAAQVLDGAVVGGSSDVDVLTITLVLAVDPDAVHEGVAGDGAGHGQSGSNGETHLDGGGFAFLVLSWLMLRIG